MRKSWLAVMAVAVLVAGLQAQAEAVPVTSRKVKQGGLEQVVAPTCAGSTCTSPGEITIGDYKVLFLNSNWMNGTSAGGSVLSSTGLDVQRVTGGLADPLEVWITAVGYTLPDGPSYRFGGSVSGTKTGAPLQVPVSFQAFLHFGLDPFNTSNALNNTSCLPWNGTVITMNCSATAPDRLFANVGNVDFTMTTRTVFDISQTDFDTRIQSTTTARVVAVPEPVSVVLFGAGLLGLAALRRRSRR
jgi:hypothetical protein